MSAFESGENGSVMSCHEQQILMDAALAPGVNGDVAAIPGFIPMQSPQVQNLPPASSITNGSSISNALPSRMQLLQEAVQLSTITPTTREDKMDLLLAMMTSMFKLLLLDQIVGQSGGSSPLSLLLSSSNTSASSGGDPSSPTIGPGQPATAAIQVPGQATTAAAHFICPACPSSNAPLTEKSFNKHIQAWKKKVRGGVSSTHARRKEKPGSCPGIRSLSHPLVAGLQGDITARVDQVVDHTVSLLSPGANAAHTSVGTGNFRRVQQYFDFLKSMQS
jgi:hypothetical protein